MTNHRDSPSNFESRSGRSGDSRRWRGKGSTEAFNGGRLSSRGKLVKTSSDDISTTPSRVLMGWSIALSLLTFLILGGFVITWLRGQAHRQPSAAPTAARNRVQIESRFMAPSEKDALELVKRALVASDPDEIAACFRLGGASPAEIAEFIVQSPARDGKIEHYVWLSSIDVEGWQVEGVQVNYAGKKRPGIRLALLTPNEEGVWKIDFEAFARTSKPGWQELLEGRAESSQVRVYAAATNQPYFNGPFADDQLWVCFSMQSPESNSLLPDDKQLLYGYCPVQSAQAKAMARILKDKSGSHRVTLELSRKQGADIRQYEISRVMAAEWVLGASRYDDKFEQEETPHVTQE